MPQELLKQIRTRLTRAGNTLAVAESCTGGLASKLLTDLPGSSRYFLAGVVAYSNEAKITILKVKAAVIRKEGAVSCAVAKEMAKSVRKLARADFGIGITGIAGPKGGTAKKPAGTVFIALDSRKKTICRKCVFSGTRPAVRKKAALEALRLLQSLLLMRQ